MTNFKRISAVFLCVVTLLSVFFTMALSVSAATSGGSRTATITVKTKANYWLPGASSITLKQDKQTMTCERIVGTKTKTKSGYFGRYDIVIYNVTKNTRDTAFWDGGQTKKIKLDPNCTYKITVTYNDSLTNWYSNPPFGYTIKKISSPGWRVSSNWKVTSCR